MPFRWRKVSPLTSEAQCEDGIAILKNGIDRNYDKKDNGVWVAPGEVKINYSWTSSRRISGVRLVFDSDMRHRSKRMRKLEATTERVQMPVMLAKAFRIEARVGGGMAQGVRGSSQHTPSAKGVVHSAGGRGVAPCRR